MKMQNVCENACKGLVTPSLVQGAEVQHETVKKREGETSFLSSLEDF